VDVLLLLLGVAVAGLSSFYIMYDDAKSNRLFARPRSPNEQKILLVLQLQPQRKGA
jgi:hypothetical protein